MSKRQMIMLLGFVIIILPFLGFDSFTKTIISIIVGLLCIMVAYRAKPGLIGDIIIKHNEENIGKDLPYIESITENSKNGDGGN